MFPYIHLFRSHETAKVTKVLDGYKVYLTPHVKPEREQMSDIIKCSGGQAFDYEPSLSPDDKVVVVSCEEDLGMCRAALDAGVAVHSTELILGGVLRQELDLHSYPNNLYSRLTRHTGLVLPLLVNKIECTTIIIVEWPTYPQWLIFCDFFALEGSTPSPYKIIITLTIHLSQSFNDSAH